MRRRIFFDEHKSKRAIARQLGVTEAVISVPGHRSLPEGLKPWDYDVLKDTVEEYEKDGLKVSVIEGPTPLDKVKLGLPGRDEEIGAFLYFDEEHEQAGYSRCLL